MAARIKLHHILFLGFTLIAAIPVIFLATWVQQSALDKEVGAVAEKHLLLAHNVTRALTRYIVDVEAAFRMAVRHLEAGQTGPGLREMLQALHLKAVWITDAQGAVVHDFPNTAGESAGASPRLAQALLPIAKKALGAPGRVYFSDVIADDLGEPTLFLLFARPGGRLAHAALSTAYLVDLQQAISFGKHGHAAIVDRTGRVLAHPDPAWRREMKDLSAVKPVGQMKLGKTGVIKFFSPATQADMIAGYTVVPGVGWGIMIPQPYGELEERAADVQLAAAAIALFGIFFAGLLGWMLARYLAGPIQAVVVSAREVAEGRLTARVPEFSHFVPYEMRELLGAFNRMVDEVSANTAMMEETAARLANAQRIARLANWEWDVENNRLSYSPEFQEIFPGLPLATRDTFEAYQRSVHPADRQAVAAAFARALYEGQPFDLAHRFVMPDQSERFVHLQAEVHFDDDGRPLRMHGTTHDITERRRAEQLQESEERFRSLVGQAAEAFFLHDEDGAILEVNQHACDSLGYSREELLTLSMPQIEKNLNHEEFVRLIASASQGRPVTYIGNHCRKDGGCFPVEVQIGPIESGGERRMLALARDISRRVRVQERLRQSQQLEAMGTLAGGIAHDFNNILTPILGFTKLVLERLPPGSQEHTDLGLVLEAAERARDIVSQILVFGRQSGGRFSRFDLRLHMEETVRFLRSTLPRTIVIREAITPDPAFVHGDTTRINQILINLTVNARQAMPEGGVLSIGLEKVRLRDFECLLGQCISGEYVRLRVADSGVGIDAEHLPHIFEPFFTTKPVGQGTGLGLATVLGIVEQHGGALNVVSSEGEGTTFDVYLKEEEPGAEQAPLHPQFANPMGTESILLIDDEPPIVNLGRRVLEAFGYEVTAFTSPMAALDAFRAEPARYQLVITDQMMGGMTGEKLVGELRSIRQDIPIILCTGYSESITAERMRQLGLNGFYHKPITPEGLAGLVRQALGGSAPPPN